MLRRLFGAALFLAAASMASAATIEVNNPAEFQAALTTAQSNGENDVIDVQPCSGTGCATVGQFIVYDITTPLTYTADASEGFSLTIDGTDSDTRILRGIGVQILSIDTLGATDDFAAQIRVQGMTLVEGNNAGVPNDGGALSIRVNSALVEVSGSVFGGNAADGDGGALFIRAEGLGELPIVIDDVTFDTNSAGGDGGGAFVAARGSVEVQVLDTEFFDNDAANGGGLHVEGLDPSDPAFRRVGQVRLFDFDFTDNIARSGNGGGADIAANGLDLDIGGFVGNTASAGNGGGMFVRSGFIGLDMVNVGFTRNLAGIHGGGFATDDNDGAFVTITNNTIFDNEGGNDARGGGAYLTVGGSTGLARIYNNIIHSNDFTGGAGAGQDIFINNDPFSDIPATVQFFNNDITDLTGFPDSSTFFDIISSVELTSGSNIDAAPLLPSIGDVVPDPSQAANSPTIDVGDNNAPGLTNVDFEFEARPVDGNGDMVATVDIGMDEYTPGAMASADMAVSKTDSPDPVTGGENVTYTITVENIGPDAATGVSVVDTLDQTSTFVSANFPQGSPCTTAGTPVVVTCVLGDVASGESVIGTIVVTSPAVTAVAGIANSVTVSANEADPVPTNNTAQEGTTVVPPGPAQADLAVTMQDTPDPVFSGGPTLTYTITVDNNGVDPATGVTLVDTLPAGVTFVSATASTGQCDAMPDMMGELSCGLGSLAVNSNATVTIVVRPDEVSSAVDITNTASVSAVEEDPNTANNTANETTTVNPPSSDVTVGTSLTPASPLIGDPITYQVTVDNDGPSDNTNVVLVVTLPEMVSFGSANIDQGSCDVDGTEVTCTIGDMAATATVTAQINVTAPQQAMTLDFAAVVSADVSDPTPNNNVDSSNIDVIDVIDLVIEGESEGTGSFGWFELAILLVAAGYLAVQAARRKRVASIATALVAGVSLLVLMSPGTAEADDNKWYVGAAVGQSNTDYKASDLTSDLANLGWTISNASIDESGTAWKLYGGFQVTNWFALEAGYVDLGKVKTRYEATIPPNQIDALLNDTLSVHPYLGSGFTAAAVARWEFVPERWALAARAGLFVWESDTEVRVVSGGTGNVSGDDSGTDGLYGIGIEWRVTDRWSLTADWERYKLNEWVDVPSIGVRARF